MKHVIIGNGVAGISAAAKIRSLDSSADITVIAEERSHFYSRIRLIDFLCDEATEEDLIIRKPAWYEEKKIEVRLGITARSVDAAKRLVLTDSGSALLYDRLLLATGGRSFMPPIAGSDRHGVFTLRTLDDAVTIKRHVRASSGKVIMIGGGVLGLEAGNALRKAGCSIEVVEFLPRLLPRQTDPEGSRLLQRRMEQMGFSFRIGAATKEIRGRDRATGILLDNGTVLDADTIIVSAGVRPNGRLPLSLGLTIEKGLSVNDRMETGIAGIFAAGDLVQHRGVFYGIWPAAEQQGAVAGASMAGVEAVYEGTTISNTLKVAGIDLMAAGDIDPDCKEDAVILKDEASCIYKKLVIKGNAIAGALLCGDLTGREKILKAIENGRDIGPIRERLEHWDLEGL